MSEASSASASTSATPGAFAKRFPRFHATFSKYASSRVGKVATTAWTRRRPILFGVFLTYGVINYAIVKREAYLRDFVHPDTWLVLKVYPGSIVEAKTTPSLAMLLNSPSAGEDMPRVMELFELCKALKLAAKDERIKGIFADFSGLHVPSSVAPEPLGLAQLEEIVEAVHDFKLTKREEWQLKQNTSGEHLETDEEENSIKEITDAIHDHPKSDESNADTTDSSESQQQALSEIAKDNDSPAKGTPPICTIAWADSFDSQGSYLLASAFDQVYLQPTGDVPLTGVTMQLPFFKRALDWFGIHVHAEARREFKSMISSFTQKDGLPPAQLEDEARLLGELGHSLTYTIGVNRFSDMDPEEAAQKVADLSKRGPFSAKDALDAGLINGIKYKREVVDMLGEEPPVRTLSSYSRIINRQLDRQLNDDQRSNVAVVYLRGTISNSPGDFSASSVIKGLKEAGEDPDVSSIVLRIDSGGGDAIASDSIWDAVKHVQEKHNKPVIASFGNASASGGYYAAAGADAILACESTITGSIGVASLRPTFTLKFFEKIGVRLQTLLTGSKMMSTVHELEPEDKERYSRHIDHTYEGFLSKVCNGRSISRDVIEELAGGRVWTGLAAYIRCNAEKELVQEGEPDKKEQAKGDSHVAVTAGTLAKEWQASDVTQENQMSTMFIGQKSQSTAGQKAHTDSEQRDEESESSLSKMVEALDESEEKSISQDDRSDVDEDSRLANAAHQAAEASQKEHGKGNGNPSSEGSEEEELGPYGRGLVDAIGGLYDAGFLAMSMGLQREIDELIKQGMTLEQATETVRPGCPRQVTQDGTMALGSDLRLIRYPKEKTFRERVREMNRKGDQPTMSLFFPGLGNIVHQLKAQLSHMAVSTLVRTWSDPEFVQKVVGSLEQERRMKMEHVHSIHI